MQKSALQKRISDITKVVSGHTDELNRYRNNKCAGIACDTCVVKYLDKYANLVNDSARCDYLQYNLIPNGNKLIEKISNNIAFVDDASQNLIETIDSGVLNFIYDYRDSSGSIPTVPVNTQYESNTVFDPVSALGSSQSIDAGILSLTTVIADYLTAYSNMSNSYPGTLTPSLAADLATHAANVNAMRSAVTSKNAVNAVNATTIACNFAYSKIYSNLYGQNSTFHNSETAAIPRRVTYGSRGFTSPADEASQINAALDVELKRFKRDRLRIDTTKPQIMVYLSYMTALNITLRTPVAFGSYTRPMSVLGTLTSKNQDELATSAALVKRIWLAIPNHLEQYIYVNPDTMSAYIRPQPVQAPFTSDMKCMTTYNISADGSTYTLNEYANNFNKRFCITEIKPDLLALLPVQAQSFISSYIQSRRRRISEIVIRSNKDYQEASTAFQRYQNDLSGQSLKIIASNIENKIFGSSSKGISQYGGSTKKNIYLTRMILENMYNITAVASTENDYIDASAAYLKYKSDELQNRSLSTVAVEGLVMKYMDKKSNRSKSLFSAMVIASTAAVNQVNVDEPDFKAAQESRRQYLKDLAGNTVLKATSSSEKVSRYVGGNSTLTKSYFTIILQINSTDIGLIDKKSTDYTSANSAFVACISVAADANLSIEEKVRKYIGSGSAMAKAIFAILIGSKEMEKVSFNMPPSILPTPYFKNRNTIIYDQIAQGFYNMHDGRTSMAYIYDIFPVGSSILDVRYDKKIISPGTAVADMKRVTTAYRDQLVQNLSVNQRAALIANFQSVYGEIRDAIADAPGGLTPGATCRLFYTMKDDTITINAIAQDQAAAGSFYTQYNCGLETPTYDNPGKINYTPITNYTQNASDPLDCTNKATLIQIGIDYVDALNADMADALQTVSNPWDQNSNLYVTKILGVKQLTPLSCNLQWEETAFDYLTNKAGPARVRNVLVSYLQNSSSWFATDIIFDASGFKYLSSAPTGLTMLNPPMVLPPPYIDDAKLDDGGICPKVSCSDPATLYRMLDEYNTNDDNPGVILRVVKAVTMNTGQCDLLVDMDYTTRPNEDNNRLEGTFREQISLLLSLDIPTCKYNLIDYDIGYGIQDQTPLMRDEKGDVKPFSYIFNFGVNIFKEISKAANSVKDRVTSVYELAQNKLITYRESTFANLGNIRSFDGCPRIQCHSIDIMSAIFQKYDRDNKFKNRMSKIIQVGTSAPNTCDVLFEQQPISGWNDTLGEPTYGPIKTDAARFKFKSDSASPYDSIFDKQIETLIASGASDTEIQKIRDQKAAVSVQASCSFVVEPYSDKSYMDIIPSKPTVWDAVRDLSNGIPVLNPSKNDPKKFSEMFPYPNPFPSMTINCKDYKIINAIRNKSIERRYLRGADVIGYRIDSSVPGTLTVTDVTAPQGYKDMNPKTLVYSKNSDNNTCAVEMIMDGDYRVHRQFSFDIDDKLQYRMIHGDFRGTMPYDLDAHLSYKEFRDISYSKIYAGVTSTKPFLQSDSVHTYSYRAAPEALNLSISKPIPLIIDPVCKLDMTKLETVAVALKYNGYPKPYEVAAFPPEMTDLSRSYEIRITENEYLPFASTYKIVSFYTSGCNPIINTFEPSNPIVSQLTKMVGNFNDLVNLTALREYITSQFGIYISDARPQKKLGRIWSGGVDSITGLYVYSVTMGEYDADGNTLRFYGYPQNDYDTNVLPRAYIACDFRRRFSNPTVIYVANMITMNSAPNGLTLSRIADTSSTQLDDPFETMKAYRYLEFTPLAIRKVSQRTNQKVQLTRLEFYVGNTVQAFTGSLNGEILEPGAVTLKSIRGFGDIFKSDGQTVDVGTQKCFICNIRTPINAYSAKAIKVDGLSFMTGRDPAFDIVQWKLRGSFSGTFWKDLYTSPELDYPAYGFWRVPMTSFQNMSIMLPQNPTRPKGFVECGATVNTVDMVNLLSRFTYTTYSKSYFPAYQEQEKNTSRVYLRDLSDMIVDDFNNTVYIRGKVDTLDNKYNLTQRSVNFVLSFQRTKNCVQPQDYSITTTRYLEGDLMERYLASPYAAYQSSELFTAIPAFRPITLVKRTTDTLPFAYGGYPSALTKYTRSSISLEPVPPYTVTSFISNGPDRPATVTLSQALTNYSNMSPEGAAQMCQDNLTCLGFSINQDGMSGSFVSTPTSTTTIVDSAGVGNSAFFVKSGFNLIAYVRFRSMKSGSPLSISKVAFYKGSTLSTFTLNAGNSYEINADGSQVDKPQLMGWELANLVNYSSTAGWKATGVDGFMLRFETPLLFDGYTFVTTSLSTASDPTAWIVETSMNGKNWTLFDTRNGVTPPATRFAVYPVFKPSKDSGVSTDFVAKTLDTCKISCTSLIPKMTELYMRQTNNWENNFFVDLIGYNPTTNQCILGWDDAAGNPRVTGFEFKPVFGDCANISKTSNITIKNNLAEVKDMNRIPDTGQFKYIRFKPTALNGGKGTSLAFIGFLYEGKLLVPGGVTNVAGSDIQNVDGVIDITLSTQWKSNGLGNLIFNFNTLTSADSFTMITGSDPTLAPVSWILESSPDMIVWSVLHEQKSPVVVPAARKQYQVYYFNGTVQTPVKGVLDKTIQDAGYTCSSNEIINGDGGQTVTAGVNDEAFNRSIFFNPISYTYDNLRNQCNYKQGSDGSTLTVTFSTITSRSSTKTKGFVTTITNVVKSSTPLIGETPFRSGLQGISDCSPQPARDSCNNQELLDKINTAYKLAPINTNKAPLSAVATGYDTSRNECIFELDDMYAPLNGSGGLATPLKQIGFQIKKNTGCTVPGAQALIINTAVPAGGQLTKTSSPGPFTFVRFKVTQGGLKIGAFEFFKNGAAQAYNATVSNPLGTYTPTDVVGGLKNFTDSSVKPKPIQFQFASPLNFDGYSWTTSDVAGGDPVAWILQASTNGYIWTDLDLRTDMSVKARNFKMPIYGLNGSVTARQMAVAQTYSLGDRGVECRNLNATETILKSKEFNATANFNTIADSNGFSTEASNIEIISTSTGNNACTFTFMYKDDPTFTTYSAVVTYEMSTSIADKTAKITNIKVT